jgi:hypothetical protein
MAKRKNELADKLGSTAPEPRPGWRDTIISGQQPVDTAVSQPPQPTQYQPTTKRTRTKPKSVRKTYLLPPELIQRIEITAEEERVGISELVNFLMTTSLDLIESGQIEIPTQTARRKIV